MSKKCPSGQFLRGTKILLETNVILDLQLFRTFNIWFYHDFHAKHFGGLSRWIVVFGPCRALRGVRAQFQKCVYNSTSLILSWFLCQTFGGVFKFDCCFWAKSTIAKMCEHSNILDFILIFVPNSWGSYQVRLLSLGPEGGLDCTNSKKMSVHFNIFYSILILCQTFQGGFKLDCCLWELRGKGTIFKMYLQFNIPDFIFIFVPNILGSYLSLRMRPLDRAIFGPCWAQ